MADKNKFMEEQQTNFPTPANADGRTSNNTAKFTFFYLLSLVALIFMALSTGMIIFQVINKNIIDILEPFRGQYSSGALKFAISAIIISAPIYYAMVAQINKNLFSGKLDKNSGARRWLTYLILFISSIVMIGWLIATIYSFLEGELTTKFILKSLTAIAIAASIFTYYRYDIKRENIVGVKDKVIKIYFLGSLVVVIVALISAFVFVESPAETRNIKYDNLLLEKFNQIDSAINTYYTNNEKLPENLDALLEESRFIQVRTLEDELAGKKFDYSVVDENTYELCATFKTTNIDQVESRYKYYSERWEHEAGYQCLKQNVAASSEKPPLEPVRIIE